MMRLGVETRTDMRMFVKAVRERWPMDRDDLDAAIARLQEIAGEDRGRVSSRARQALTDIEQALTPAT